MEPSLALRRLLLSTDALLRASASGSSSAEDFLLKRFFRPAIAADDYKTVVGGMVAVAAVARYGGRKTKGAEGKGGSSVGAIER